MKFISKPDFQTHIELSNGVLKTNVYDFVVGLIKDSN